MQIWTQSLLTKTESLWVGQFEISLAPHFSAVIRRSRCDINRFNGFHPIPLTRFTDQWPR